MESNAATHTEKYPLAYAIIFDDIIAADLTKHLSLIDTTVDRCKDMSIFASKVALKTPDLIFLELTDEVVKNFGEYNLNRYKVPILYILKNTISDAHFLSNLHIDEKIPFPIENQSQFLRSCMKALEYKYSEDFILKAINLIYFQLANTPTNNPKTWVNDFNQSQLQEIIHIKSAITNIKNLYSKKGSL